MSVLVIAGLGLWQTGSGVWIYAKAQLAQVLLEQTWVQTLSDQTPSRPWPWADTSPVARLIVPSLDMDVIVLQGDSGRSLAFGPGLAAGSAPPGQPGTKLISAHRDTHFRTLGDIHAGDLIELQTSTGPWRYSVKTTEVMDIRYAAVANDPLRDELVLMTCYPFDAVVPGGPLRFVVGAEPAEIL